MSRFTVPLQNYITDFHFYTKLANEQYISMDLIYF